MSDWKEIDFDEFGRKALNIGKISTEKGKKAFENWQKDDNRLAKKEEKNRKKHELKASFKLINKKEVKAKLKQSLLGSCALRQKQNNLVYFENDENKREYNLISFEWSGPKIVQRSNTTTETTGKKKGIGRAIIGGVIAGPAGAIVGGVTGKSKGTSTSNTSFYEEEIATKSILLLEDVENKEHMTLHIKIFSKDAEIISTMLTKTNTTKLNLSKDSTTIVDNPFDEVIKFKELLDLGIITQEEFDDKKRKLLGL